MGGQAVGASHIRHTKTWHHPEVAFCAGQEFKVTIFHAPNFSSKLTPSHGLMPLLRLFQALLMAPHTQYRDEDRDVPQDIPYLTDDETDAESPDANLHFRAASESSDAALPVPVWMRESSKDFKYRWVPLPMRKAGRSVASWLKKPVLIVWMQESTKSFRYRWVPLPVRKAGRAVMNWVKGPVPPRELRIQPYFPWIQEAPIRLLDKYLPKRRHRIVLLVVFYACWFLAWSLMLRHNSGSAYIKGYGKPENLWCGASFWNDGNGCGLNGNNCRPFSSAHMAFRCPADCRSAKVYQPHIVGNKTFQYKGLVVGGPNPDDAEEMPTYRADSFICQAAIHSGVVGEDGGCGVATLVGPRSGYRSSELHGIKSIPFPASFPRSFTFQTLSESQQSCPIDSRWPLFVVTAISLVLLSLFTTSPAAFFFSTFVMLMFHVGLVSDPPNTSNVYELLSTLFARLLPGAFIACILYRYCARPLLSGLRAQIEKTVLYLGFCFIGALNNYTFAPLIPIQRLTPHDLRQPGASLALAIILCAIVAIVIGQIHFIRISGNMPRYLAIYATILLSLLIFMLLPGLRLRIHHYILALVFMPGTGFQTRPGLIYQGLLLGLFINGVARWGFASIVQTPTALGESGGGGEGSWWGANAPNVSAIVGPDVSNITFNWGPMPTDRSIDGVSILINDVERWRGYLDEELYWKHDGVTLDRRRTEEGEPEFFRFAWMNGNNVGRYSKVGLWDEEGVWHAPAHSSSSSS